nr:restriction endonuclease subunit S [uncultured Treponema sp.]
MKQTEIGMIPDDWEVTTIGQQTEIFGRIGFRGYTINDIVDEGFGAITLSPSNIQNNKMDYSKCTYLSWAKYEESPEIKIFDGDILIVKTGSTYGKSAIVKNLRKKATINPQFVVLKKIKCSNELLSYLIQNPIIQSQIEEAIVGGAIPTLSQKQIASFKLPLPPTLAEQQKIAKALSDVDNVITTLEKLITKKKNLKQGTMQQLLTGKKRLPGFAKSDKFKQTEIGEIPEDWEVKTFGNFATIVRGGSPRPIQDYLTNNSDGINWIKIGDVNSEDKYIVKTEEKIIPAGKSRSREVHIGDFILSNSMSFGRPYILKINGCIHDGWLAIQNYQETFDSDFLYYLLGSDKIFEQYISMAAGSSVQNLNKQKVSKLKVPIPSKPEQTAIANVLSSMDKEIEALAAKLGKYRDLKTGMMQQLLTGKIRLR